MEALIRGAKALGPVAEYDFTGNNGERYRYVDLYDDGAGKVIRVSLDRECSPPALGFGSTVDLWVRIDQGEKIVRGEDRDRTFGSLKLKAVSIELAEAAGNGAGSAGAATEALEAEAA
jgi:hypothetical protein